MSEQNKATPTITVQIKCATCGQEPPEAVKRIDRLGWTVGPYGDFLCPEHAPSKVPDTPEIKQLRAKIKTLRAGLREYEADDPDRELIRAEIEDAEMEIEDAEMEIENLRRR